MENELTSAPRSGNRIAVLIYLLAALASATACSAVVDPDTGALDQIPSDDQDASASGGTGPASCSPGSFTPCECAGGNMGRKLCRRGGTFGDCNCGEDGGSGDGGQADAGATGGSGGEADVSGSGGTEGEAGEGGNGGEAGSGGSGGEAGAEAGVGGSGKSVLYGPCDQSRRCEGELICETAFMNRGNFCTKRCEPGEKCPAGSSRKAPAVCDPIMQTCRLDCATADRCPDGMTCISMIARSSCYWF